jgi:hypothetical protein
MGLVKKPSRRCIQPIETLDVINKIYFVCMPMIYKRLHTTSMLLSRRAAGIVV